MTALLIIIPTSAFNRLLNKVTSEIQQLTATRTSPGSLWCSHKTQTLQVVPLLACSFTHNPLNYLWVIVLASPTLSTVISICRNMCTQGFIQDFMLEGEIFFSDSKPMYVTQMVHKWHSCRGVWGHVCSSRKFLKISYPETKSGGFWQLADLPNTGVQNYKITAF